ncbi:restriction endonuclease subunit S [Cellulomonas soli]
MIDPSKMPDVVDLFSIPALDATGTPETVGSSTIDSGKLRLAGGEVLISKLNPRKSRIHLVPESLARTSVSSPEFVVLKARPDVDRRFLAYALASERVRQGLDSEVRSATRSHQRVEPSTVLGTAVWAPGSEEQRLIADFLDDQVSRIDQAVHAREQQGALLAAATRAELVDLLLTPTDGVVPLRRMIADERLGIWGDERGVAPVDVRVARVADFDRTTFGLRPIETIRSVEPGQLRPRLLAPGDVLLERSGGTQHNPVGCPAFVEGVDGPTVSSNFVSRLRAAPGVGHGRFIALLLGAMYWTRQQGPFSTQTTGIQNLDSAAYLSTRVPRRAFDDQVRLASDGARMIDTMVRRQQSLLASIHAYRQYRQSLITAAVTGELDVTTASGRGMPG